MEQKHFYSHIIEIDTFYIKLNELDLSNEEWQELITIVHSSVHHIVLDTVLSELPEEEKKTFLTHFANDDHDSIWKHLEQNVENAEKKIANAVHEFLEELHEDVNSQR